MDIQALFGHLIRHVPRVCATDATQLLLHHYETKFGIFDHDYHPNKDNPLALILMQPAESVHGALFERIDEFEERQIGERFKMSLIEFLSLPREWCDYLSRQAVKRQKENNEVQMASLRKLDELQRGSP